MGKELGNQEWMRLGLRAGNYALREQNPDGSLFYWGRVQNQLNPNRIDHYHSGFEIRSLYEIWRLTGLTEYGDAAAKYYDFYLAELLDYDANQVLPRMYPHDVYPINIHSCAEALLLNATMAAQHPEALDLVKSLFFWIRDHMQSKKGYFFYMRRRMKGLEITSRIPYMRWGQAWMLLALSQVLQQQDKRSSTV